jgi:hypothetical protein
MATSTIVAPAACSSFATRSMASATSRSPVMLTKRWRNTPMRLPRSVAASRPAANEPATCASASAVTGSSASVPVTRSSASATSRTDFAIGPTASLYVLSGITPARLVSPRVVRMVASEANEAGFESELHVSVPKPSAARLAATAVALPPLDPEVLSEGS